MTAPIAQLAQDAANEQLGALFQILVHNGDEKTFDAVLPTLLARGASLDAMMLWKRDREIRGATHRDSPDIQGPPLCWLASLLALDGAIKIISLCDPRSRDQHGRDAMMNLADLAPTSCSNIQAQSRFAQLLLPLFDPDATDVDGRDALMLACAQKNFTLAKTLLPLSDPRRLDAQGKNALIALLDASSDRRLPPGEQALVFELAAQSDLSIQDANGFGSAHYASLHRQIEIVEFFLPLGERFPACPKGLTPLMLAAGHGANRIARVAQACDPHAVDLLGRDALMVAIEWRHEDAAKTLAPLSDLTRRDQRLESALDKARLLGLDALADFLLPLDLAQNEAKALRQTCQEPSSAARARL